MVCYCIFMTQLNGRILRRQGDLLFKQIQEIPSLSEKMEGVIVAHGESGNLHQASGGQIQLFRKKHNPTDLFSPRPDMTKVHDPLQVDYLEVHQDTVLLHEEHKEIALPKGKYVVVHEREYNPFAIEAERIRQVID